MKRISSNIRCFRLDFRSAKYEIHTVRISRSVRLVKLSIHQMRVELLGNHILLSIPRKMEWIDPANGDSVSLHLEPIDITAGINLARSPRYSDKGENLQTLDCFQQLTK